MSKQSNDGDARLTIAVGPKDHVKGAEHAPITLVEYGDFPVPVLREAYPSSSRSRSGSARACGFAFRNFPLTRIHQFAQHAAEAAEAAAAQGAYWQMHDRLFERQFALEDENLLEYARDLASTPTGWAAS